MKKIIIVEDELAISNLIKIHLDIAGYETSQVYDGLEAFHKIEKEKFDLILLDVMIPNIDGFSLIKKINHLAIPVIFLTAKNSVMDKVQGLKLGAEDYIVKPFEAIELLTRIEVVFRRYGKNDKIVSFKDLTILLEDRIVKKNNEIVNLTLKEFELLILLLKNKNIALSRDQILESVWGYEYFGETRTVDTHIQKLRKKLGLIENIKTVFKIGYRMED